MKALDLKGKEFGRLTVVRQSEPAGQRTAWLCQCECDTSTIVLTMLLQSGGTRSCGCLVRETMSKIGKKNATHGKSHTLEYNSWRAMIARCYDTKNNRYRLYGATGITVCDRWLNNFEKFLADMGERPTSKHSIDRWPDKTGNYEKSNCRWATASQQNKNRRPFNRSKNR